MLNKQLRTSGKLCYSWLYVYLADS
jgi:hypothetical protein